MTVPTLKIQRKAAWSLVNSLLGKNCKSIYINELKINDSIITDSALISESQTLNNYFINIAHNWPTKLRLMKSPTTNLIRKMPRFYDLMI